MHTHIPAVGGGFAPRGLRPHFRRAPPVRRPAGASTPRGERKTSKRRRAPFSMAGVLCRHRGRSTCWTTASAVVQYVLCLRVPWFLVLGPGAGSRFALPTIFPLGALPLGLFLGLVLGGPRLRPLGGCRAPSLPLPFPPFPPFPRRGASRRCAAGPPGVFGPGWSLFAWVCLWCALVFYFALRADPLALRAGSLASAPWARAFLRELDDSPWERYGRIPCMFCRCECPILWAKFF